MPQRAYRIGLMTPVCEEDEAWVPQYLAEAERLRMPFAIHFDRCSLSFKKRLTEHRLYVGSTSQDDPSVEHVESARQGPYDVLRREGFHAGVISDLDETYEPAFRERLAQLMTEDRRWSNGRVYWVNLWNDPQTIRVDNPSNPHRVKILRFDTGIIWRWKGLLVVDPYAKGTRAPKTLDTGLFCVHWGLMTRELREFHKARWDRVYGAALGKNPYDYWDYLLDEVNHPPTLAPLSSLIK